MALGERPVADQGGCNGSGWIVPLNGFRVEGLGFRVKGLGFRV